jgi:hypothetical protein
MRTRIVPALALLVLALTATTAHAHQGNPNFRSTVTAVSPPAPGVEAEVLNLDDRLLLSSDGDATVEVQGYDGEPYVRILPGGEVQVNTRSPAYYLNQDRFAEATVPDDADPKAPPEWKTVSSGGSYEWHDHRIHWMAKTTPPQVKDEAERTKVFDWKVPIEVDGQPASIAGELVWVPDDSGFPIAAIVALAAVGLASVALVVFVRRRRGRDDESGEAGNGSKEAW